MHGQQSTGMPELGSITAPVQTAALPSELTLRLCGTPQDGRLVRLRGIKCIIGSDSQCTLRLRAPGISPQHCLIIRGPERTVVRHLAGESRLNGRSFSEAVLKVGDRLTIGSIEFEVVDGVGKPSAKEEPGPVSQATPPAPIEKPAAAPWRADPQPAGGAAAEQIRAAQRQLNGEQERLVAEQNRIVAEQVRLVAEHERLVTEENRLRTEREAFVVQQRKSQAELAGEQAALGAARDALKAERTAIERNQTAWQREREQLLADVAGQTEALNVKTADVERRRCDLERAEQDVRAVRGQLEQHTLQLEADRKASELAIRERGDELESRRQQLDHEVSEVESLRHQLHERLADLESQAAELANDRDQLAVLREVQAEELTRDRGQLIAERGQLISDREGQAAERRQVAAERVQLEQDKNSLLQETQSVAAEKEHLAGERSCLAHERQALEQSRAAIDDDRRKLEQLHAAREQDRAALERSRADFEQVRVGLERQRADFEQIRAGLERQRTELDLARAAVESQEMLLQQELRDFEEHKHSLTLERLDWQTYTSQAESETVARREELDRSAAALEKQLAEQESVRRRLEESQKGLAKRQDILQTAENELLERQRQLQELRLVVEELQHKLNEERTLLNADQQALSTDQQALSANQQALSADRQTLNADRQALSADRQTLNADRRTLDADRQAVESERVALAGEREAVESVRNQGRAQENEWSSRLADQTRQMFEATERLNRATQELQDKQTMLERAYRDLDQERRQWDSERARLQHDYEQQLATLRSEFAACIHPENQSSAPAGQLATECDARQADLSRWAEELQQQADALQREAQDLGEQRKVFEAQLEAGQQATCDAEDEWTDQTQHLNEHSQVTVQADEATVLDEYSRADAYAASSDDSNAYASPELNVSSDISYEPTGERAESEPDVEPSQSMSFVETETNDGYRDQSAAAVPEASDECAASPDEVPEVSFNSAVEQPQFQSPSHPHPAAEESIDDYMAGLLNRMRGTAGARQPAASHASEPAAEEVRSTKSQSSASAPLTVETQTVREVPTKLERRPAAPELSSDLAAMRELANLSARTAIDQHAYRNWGRAAFGKLTIALLAAGAGAGAVYFAPAPDSMLMYAGLSSFVVTLFWLLQAGILLKQVINASRRNARRAEDAEADAAASSPSAQVPDCDEDALPSAEIIAVCESDQTTMEPDAEAGSDHLTAETSHGEPVFIQANADPIDRRT